jgi:hypothetical protein
MSEVITIGVDLAKNVFQVHGVDAEGEVIFRRQLRRSQMLPFFKKQPSCLVGLEACASAHHWARQLIELGHEVKLMPPHYVKPYVKRNKNDMADAEAICEAVTRPTMRFVSVKNMEQQSVLMLHRTRNLLVRQRTMLINAIRAHMAEFGIVAPGGVPQVKKLLKIIADTDDTRLPPIARTCLESLARQFLSLHDEVHAAEKHIHTWQRSNEASWQPGSVLFPGKTQQVESSGSAKSPNRAISIYVGCLLPGLCRSSSMQNGGRRQTYRGLPILLSANQPKSQPWRWPTRTPVLSGRCSGKAGHIKSR